MSASLVGSEMCIRDSAPPAQASSRVALWISRIRAFWTTNRSPKDLPCFAWLTQRVIARSKEKPKKTSELTNPIFEIQFRGLPLGNNQRLFPFLTSSIHSIQQPPDSPRLKSPGTGTKCRHSSPVNLHLRGAAKPHSGGVASLAKQGSMTCLDTKESKDCF